MHHAPPLPTASPPSTQTLTAAAGLQRRGSTKRLLARHGIRGRVSWGGPTAAMCGVCEYAGLPLRCCCCRPCLLSIPSTAPFALQQSTPFRHRRCRRGGWWRIGPPPPGLRPLWDLEALPPVCGSSSSKQRRSSGGGRRSSPFTSSSPSGSHRLGSRVAPLQATHLLASRWLPS